MRHLPSIFRRSTAFLDRVSVSTHAYATAALLIALSSYGTWIAICRDENQDHEQMIVSVHLPIKHFAMWQNH